MPHRALLRPHVRAELTAASAAADAPAAWRHLERAHILSQPSAWLHTRVHLAMLVLALRTRDVRELFGQLVRLAVGGIGSSLGRYPAGNTGRARVPATRPMPIPDDVQAVFAQLGIG
jgi:hypothetical protein